MTRNFYLCSCSSGPPQPRTGMNTFVMLVVMLKASFPFRDHVPSLVKGVLWEGRIVPPPSGGGFCWTWSSSERGVSPSRHPVLVIRDF